jgi:hypothetical protein
MPVSSITMATEPLPTQRVFCFKGNIESKITDRVMSPLPIGDLIFASLALWFIVNFSAKKFTYKG